MFFKDRVKQVVDGYNFMIIAYGESASGKTHTLVGDEWENSIRQ